MSIAAFSISVLNNRGVILRMLVRKVADAMQHSALASSSGDLDSFQIQRHVLASMLCDAFALHERSLAVFSRKMALFIAIAL